MIDPDPMDTDQSVTVTSGTPLDLDRFRLSNESDQQWQHRKQFIETFRFEYNEERLLCLAQCYANTKCLGCRGKELIETRTIGLLFRQILRAVEILARSTVRETIQLVSETSN